MTNFRFRCACFLLLAATVLILAACGKARSDRREVDASRPMVAEAAASYRSARSAPGAPERLMAQEQGTSGSVRNLALESPVTLVDGSLTTTSDLFLRLSGQILDDQDLPVAEAAITLFAPPSDEKATSVTAHSSKDGRFVLDGLSSGTALITAEAYGFVSMGQKITLPAENLTLRLSSGGTLVTGRLFVKESGEAASSATVTLTSGEEIWTPMGRFSPQTTATDSMGTFRFHHLPAGEFKLSARRGELRLMPGPDGKVHRLRLLDEETTTLPDLYMYGGHTVTGTVRDRDTSRPLEGVIIWAGTWDNPRKSKTATSGADGRYRLTGVQPGEASLNLYVERRGYQIPVYRYYPRPYLPMTLEPGKLETRVDVEMIPGVTATGTVTTQDGKPFAGARVMVSWQAWVFKGAAPFVLTDADGRYELDVTPHSSFAMRAEADGFPAAFSRSVPMKSTAVTDVDIVLLAGADVSGVVVDEQGRPAAGATVKARRGVSSGSSGWTEELTDTTTGKEGEFSFRAMPTDAGLFPRSPVEIRLTATRTGTAPSEVEILKLAPGEAKTGVRLVLRASHYLAGRVTDFEGRPIEGAKLSVHTGSDWLATSTDSAGGYELDGLPPGSLSVSISHDDHQQESFEDVAVDRRDADFVLKGQHVTLLGHVLASAGGAPVSDFSIVGRNKAEKIAGEVGRFRLPGLTGGDNTQFRITSPGYAGYMTPWITVPDNVQTFERTFRLSRPGKVTGRIVTGENRAPVSGVTVSLWLDPELSYEQKSPESSVVTGDDGRFELTGARAGTNTVNVEPPVPHVTTSRRVSVPEAGEADAGDIVVGEGGSVRGRVVRMPGETPVSDVTILLGGYGRGKNAEATTDVDGTFEFTELADGEYGISRKDDLKSGLSVRISGGEQREVTLRVGAAVFRGVALLRGQPVGDWNVTLSQRHGSGTLAHYASTAEDGAFEIKEIPSGRWDLTIYRLRPNQGPVLTTQVDITEGENEVRNWEIPPGRLTGKVLDASDKPVGGAVVLIPVIDPYSTDKAFYPGSSQQQASTLPDGSFTFKGPLPAEPFTVYASKDGVGQGRVENVRASSDSDPTPVIVKLKGESGGSLESVALNMSTGAPISDARLRLFSDAGLHPYTELRDDTGLLTITGLAPGVWRTHVTATGFSVAEREITIEEGTPVRIEDVLYEAGTFRWTLRGLQGHGMADVPVTLTPDDPGSVEAERSGKTDTNGQWLVMGLLPGNYTATARREGQQALMITFQATAQEHVERESVLGQ